MSRAEPRPRGRRAAAVPEGPPRLGESARLAAFDFYYHSIRLVAANVVWGIAFTTVFGLAIGGLPLIAVLAAPLLAIPWVGVARLAALIVRGEDVNLSDAFEAYRDYLAPALVAGVATVAAGLVFVTNVALGLRSGGVMGWSLATLAAWGIAGTWTFALCLWPILVDPRRSAQPASSKARLAALLVVAFPGRLAVLATVAAVLAAASTVAAAAILTVSVAYVALLSGRYVLPAADRLEARFAAAGRDASSRAAAVGTLPEDAAGS